jgi:predicted outer membrane lipoprotein
MSQPWFDPMLFSWIPGTLLGVAGGILGPMAGVLAPRGKAKGLVLGSFAIVLLICLALLIAGIAGLASGQPYGVWYGLGLPGLIGLIVIGSLFPVVRLRYQQAEERKIAARDVPI